VREACRADNEVSVEARSTLDNVPFNIDDPPHQPFLLKLRPNPIPCRILWIFHMDTLTSERENNVVYRVLALLHIFRCYVRNIHPLVAPASSPPVAHVGAHKVAYDCFPAAVLLEPFGRWCRV
jgi:hypothetical protein